MMTGSNRVLFFPCFLDGLSPLSASVRFRAQWPARYMIGADAYDGTQRIENYNCFVFQKFYLTQRARAFAHTLRQRNCILAFDLCDADWLQSDTHERRLLDLLPWFHFAVAPTEPLRDWLAKWMPARVIPDRLDLSLHTVRHTPEDRQPRLIWFGNSGNIITLDQMWDAISGLGLELTVLSDLLIPPWDDRPVRFVEWTLGGANEEIARHDIALNPTLDTGVFPYKSKNKTITAWALGVPVAETPEDLERLLNFPVRCEESSYRLMEVEAEYDVRCSAREWRKLFDEWRIKQG